jgi:hypothetical protein
MSKKILLLSSIGKDLTPQGSELFKVPARDPLSIKVYKHLNYDDIKSILSDKLPVENLSKISWIILFKDAEIDIESILLFCKKNECNLLILKDKFNNINGHNGFTIIHNYYLNFEDEICKTITSRLE